MIFFIDIVILLNPFHSCSIPGFSFSLSLACPQYLLPPAICRYRWALWIPIMLWPPGILDRTELERFEHLWGGYDMMMCKSLIFFWTVTLQLYCKSVWKCQVFQGRQFVHPHVWWRSFLCRHPMARAARQIVVCLVKILWIMVLGKQSTQLTDATVFFRFL